MRISDWSSDVCSSDRSGHFGDALDLAANASSRNEHYEIDGLGDQAPGNGDDIFRNELFDTVQRGPRAVGMDGGDAAGMAGIPGLEHVEGFPAPHFADDDAVGSQAQGGAHQIGHADNARPRSERHRIRSEEHTSELQSLMRISNSVFCLKKQNPKQK